MLKRVVNGVIRRLGIQLPTTVVKQYRVDSELMERYVARRLDRTSIYVEIGSGTGEGSIPFARATSLDPANCYLIEACPVNYEVLRTAANGFHTFNLAITGRSGTVPFYVVDDPKAPGTSRSNSINLEAMQERFRGREIRRIDVPSRSLGDFFDENGIQAVDYLYFNCEGAEYEIYRGDTGFLDRCRMVHLDLHGRCPTFNALNEEKLRTYDLMIAKGFARIGGHLRDDILPSTGHLKFLFERDPTPLQGWVG